MRFSERAIHNTLYVIKDVYLVFSGLAIFLIVALKELRFIPLLLLSIIIFYGLNGLKSWVIPTILVSNFLGIANVLRDINDLQKLPFLKLLFIAFTFFEIYFFAKNEVRSCLKLAWPKSSIL